MKAGDLVVFRLLDDNFDRVGIISDVLHETVQDYQYQLEIYDGDICDDTFQYCDMDDVLEVFAK